MIRRPPRSTLFPTRRSSDLHGALALDGRGAVAQLHQLDGGDDRRERVAQLVAEDREELVLAPHRERSEEHTSELQSQSNLVCRLLLEKKNVNPTRGAGGAAR